MHFENIRAKKITNQENHNYLANSFVIWKFFHKYST